MQYTAKEVKLKIGHFEPFDYAEDKLSTLVDNV